MSKSRRFIFSIICALVVTFLIALGGIRRLDKWIQDRICQKPGHTSGDIIIIGIDDEALSEFGPYNTWDRTIMASALEALSADPEKKPAVTAIDVLYAGNTNPEADERLAQAAAELGNVVTASMAGFGEDIVWENGRAAGVNASAAVSYDLPYEELRRNTVQGHINAMCDLDGIMRHALLFVEPDGEERVCSMACETARIYLSQQGEELEYPPTGKTGFFYIPFTGLPGAYYDGVSISKLINGNIPADYWAGKIVLIGPYAAMLQDAYFTSIDNSKQMYGTEVQANVIQSLLERNFKTEVSDLLQLVLLFLVCAASMILFLRLKVAYGSILCGGLILLSLSGTVLLYRMGYVLHPLWMTAGVLSLFVLSLGAHYVSAAKARQALALEKERIDAELSLATRIQVSALPKDFPPFPDRKEFDIYASMTPAKEVGGDFYDFFMIDDDHLCMVMGDVSGKGVPAALFMMVSSALLHNAAMEKISPAQVMQKVNEQICRRNPEEIFITAWIGILEVSTGRLTAANAGHEYPAIKNPGGSFELLKDLHGFVLGGIEGTRYREYELQFEPGGKLFIYTDGVTEATDSGDTLYGTDRMLEALRSCEDSSPREVLETVSAAVSEFKGNAPQYDDLTMLCLQFNGKEKNVHAEKV